MAAVKVLARDWSLHVQDDALQWQEVKGINTLTFDGEKNDADTTTFDNDGWNSHIVASRGRSITAEGLYLEDLTTKARDAGQEFCEKLADRVGQSSLGYFKLTSPAGTVRNFYASVNVSGIGGGNDDPTAWSCEMTVSGQASIAAVLATSIAATPNTLALAAGAVSDVMGSRVAFTPSDTTNKGLTYAITSGNTYASVTPEGRVVGRAAGSATLTITTADGSNRTTTITVTVS